MSEINTSNLPTTNPVTANPGPGADALNPAGLKPDTAPAAASEQPAPLADAPTAGAEPAAIAPATAGPDVAAAEATTQPPAGQEFYQSNAEATRPLVDFTPSPEVTEEPMQEQPVPAEPSPAAVATPVEEQPADPKPEAVAEAAPAVSAPANDTAKCELCGEPMPEGEQMFKFHGYSGNCPKPPLAKQDDYQVHAAALADGANAEERPTTLSDEELQAALNASPRPRVLPEDLEAEVLAEQYWCPPGTTLTVCVVTLRNGFTVTGEAGCADPANFNAEIGRTYARKAALAKLWPLLGFRLADDLRAGRR